MVCRLFDAWAFKENKARWGDKTPHYIMDIASLVEVFPAAKVIHIIRDGRDVDLSWLKAGFEPRNLFTAATLWKRYVSAGCSAGAMLPRENYLEVRYESLLSQPVDTMRTVCAFIGEDYSEAVLHPSPILRLLRPKILGENKPGPLSRAEIVPPNVAKWKTEMPPNDRLLFESVAGDLLTFLGYETSGVTRIVSAGERFAWKLHHRFWWTLSRLNMRGSHRWLLTEMALRRADAQGRRRNDGLPGSPDRRKAGWSLELP